jgi:chemotaxis-related protein WspD
MDITVNDCWNKIGVSGDASCSLLTTAIHCRNCAIYASAGRALLQRDAPSGYVEEWTQLLAQPLPQKTPTLQAESLALQKNDASAQNHSKVIMFRLEEEWFALPVWVIKEVTPICPIHTLPHRTNEILLGIVNICGEILIAVSLRNLLGLKPIHRPKSVSSTKSSLKPITYPRMVVMNIQENRWVFTVDEISTVQSLGAEEFHDAPTVITKTPDTYTKKIIYFQDKKVNFLEQELLFYELLFYTFSRPQ